ncbi:MAG TPA: hypothetical protein VH476_09745 [Solirubrobacterales bacterium]
MHGAGRRASSICIAAACAAVIALAASAPSASASRVFDSKIEGFNGTSSVTFAKDGKVWVTDGGHETEAENPGQNGLYEYSPFPSQNLLFTPDSYEVWHYFILWLTASVDQENGEILVSQSNGRHVDIFDENGIYTHSWSAFNEASTCFNCVPDLHIAVDNSNTFSRGRVYLSLTSPEDAVEVFDAEQHPVDFPATTSYTKDNRLTGTPEGPFGQVEAVTVDNRNGNLFVTDAEAGAVDEYDSTGTFIRSFAAPNASEGVPGRGGVAIDPTNGNVVITGGAATEYDENGNLLGNLDSETEGVPGVDSSGHLYLPTSGRVDIYDPPAKVPVVSYKPVTAPTTTSGTLNATVDPSGGGNVTECKFEYGTTTTYGTIVACNPDPAASPPASNFSSPTDVSASVSGLTVDTTYHYRVVAKGPGGVKRGADQVYTPHSVLGLRTEAASGLGESAATLNGSFVGNGADTHYFFEWGPSTAYGNATSSADAGSPGGPGRTAMVASLAGLNPFTTYHYRVVADNGGGNAYGEDQEFTTTPGVPVGKGAAATAVHADRALLHGQIDPNGAVTDVHFEYVDDPTFQKTGWTEALSAPTPATPVGMSKHFQSTQTQIDGLKPGTLYHYRATGENFAGSGDTEATFTTFPFEPSFVDPCPNTHVRQQTGTALLLDCRAYELASAVSTGGYDVESNLVAGQEPFGSYPDAEGPSRVLYGVHDGGIPGAGKPTNHGVDPYVATRGSDGKWTTEYVGIPADGTPSTSPFASTVNEASDGLGTLAFGGENLCSPCFADGSTGIPVHRPNGELVQGMVGSLNPGPGAKQAGFIGRRLSADGSHLIFGSTSKFEPDGNSNGDTTIYDRDLETGVTHVVSKTPAGATMIGAGIGELDISANGSRVVFGQLVSEEAGSRYWHLFMNVGDSTKSVDLTPGAAAGALYSGMTADGSSVYFTTTDALTSNDHDTSADLYRATVSGSGTLTLTRVSTGSSGSGDTDSCDPSANTVHEYWNTLGSSANCDVIAIGGGGGVASGDGTVYFLSPETLDGSNGVSGAPNLYVARPGSAPQYVTTLESTANAPAPAPRHPFRRETGAFEKPAGVAIDHSTGDIYVFDIENTAGSGNVQKFDEFGHPVLSFGENGKLIVPGVIGLLSLPTELALEQSTGDLFVPDLQNGAIHKYDSDGNPLQTISVPDFVSGVAVNQTNGRIYASGYIGSAVYEFAPNGTQIEEFPVLELPTGVAVNSSGTVYVVNGGGQSNAKGTTEAYTSTGTDLGEFSGEPSNGVAVDPSDDHVFVSKRNSVIEYDSAGETVGEPTGEGILVGAISLAADSGRIAVSNPGQGAVATFEPLEVPSVPSVDNPLVVDSVGAAGTRRTDEFQINPSGTDAIFTSTLPLTEYDSGGHEEVYRNDADEGLACASCNPTGEQAVSDARLVRDSSDLTADGRVFFNTGEGLVDRDLNERLDAYEWEPEGLQVGEGIPTCQLPAGCVGLISAGTSPNDSGLLGVSEDGLDAYFFTRDQLVEESENGNNMQIYDARVLGGVPFVPPPVQCKASDECHGPSSAIPPPPNIKTLAGTPIGNNGRRSRRGCKAGFVRKHGRCVKKRSKKHRKSKKRARRRGR